MELSRQHYWNRFPIPSLGDLPNPGVKPKSPALQADSFLSEPSGKLYLLYQGSYVLQLHKVKRKDIPGPISQMKAFVK